MEKALESESRDKHQAAEQHNDTARREGEKQILRHVSARDFFRWASSFNSSFARG
jgi:hypothetical protein